MRQSYSNHITCHFTSLIPFYPRVLNNQWLDCWWAQPCCDASDKITFSATLGKTDVTELYVLHLASRSSWLANRVFAYFFYFSGIGWKRELYPPVSSKHLHLDEWWSSFLLYSTQSSCRELQWHGWPDEQLRPFRHPVQHQGQRQRPLHLQVRPACLWRYVGPVPTVSESRSC